MDAQHDIHPQAPQEPEIQVTTVEEKDTIRKLVSPEGVNVYLVGSAHISFNSVEDAQKTVRVARPHIVFLEVCARRQAILSLPIKRAEPPPNVDMALLMQEFKQRGAVGVMSMVLASTTSTMAETLGIDITPGTEFAAAAQEAKQYGGMLVLGDRDVNVTLLRAWRSMTTWEQLKLLYELLFKDMSGMSSDDVERLKNSDVITEMVTELTEEMPNLVEPLIHERDRYLLYNLRMTCMQLAQAAPKDLPPYANKEKTVVAVVGMGHVSGIVKDWNIPFDKQSWQQDLKRISTIPPGQSWASVILKFVVAPSAIVIGSVVLVRRAIKR
eukprot:m.17722 g.17722  ORF g.17722 m.17722 type:complete len:326 (-) comp6092_c0_seq1:113-1090(-)